MDDQPLTTDVTDLSARSSVDPADAQDHATTKHRVWLSPLAITIDASLISILAFMVATGPDRSPDGWLTVLGWLAATVAGAGAVWFAYHTGTRDRTLDEAWRERRANGMAKRRRRMRAK